MKKYKYYTPINLAKSILELLPNNEINTVIDICCGSWNLLTAAKYRYKDIAITGVDIDENSRKNQIEGSEFLCIDGRRFSLIQKRKGKTYDLILSNPPFGYISDRDRIYNSDNFKSQCFPSLVSKRYESEMIQANLFLAHEDSFLVFILPNTFIIGDSLRKVRREIARQYNVFSIIKLPEDTFQRGKLRTFALILGRRKEIDIKTDLYEARYEKRWRMVKIDEMSNENVVEGNWWSGSCSLNQNNKFRIERGNLSTKNFTEDGVSVYHCSNKKGDAWEPSIRYYNPMKVPYEIVKARKGDILINRIGKSAGYWSINQKDDIAVSDCIIVVENNDYILKKIQKESNNEGRLNVPIHGLATSFITIKDIKAIINC